MGMVFDFYQLRQTKVKEEDLRLNNTQELRKLYTALRKFENHFVNPSFWNSSSKQLIVGTVVPIC